MVIKRKAVAPIFSVFNHIFYTPLPTAYTIHRNNSKKDEGINGAKKKCCIINKIYTLGTIR